MKRGCLMERVTSVEEFAGLTENKIIYDENTTKITNSSISFLGKNNFLVIENNANIINSKIAFKGSNSIIYIKKTKNNRINIIVDIYNDSIFFMDKDCSINTNIRIVVSEHKNLIIGKDCMFSHGCWIRNSDGHLIYDIQTNSRANISRDIIIGDHVWIGQDVNIMKSPFIGSGSILGIGSTIKSRIPSNSISSGNPSAIQREGIFWDRSSAQPFTDLQTENSLTYQKNSQDFIFSSEDNSVFWQEKINAVSKMQSSTQKIEAISNLSELPSLVVRMNKKRSFWSRLLK